MEITIVLKQKLEYLPPVINLIDALVDLNFKVNLVCTELSDYNFHRYNNVINIVLIKLPVYKFRPLKILSIRYFRQKFYEYVINNNIGSSNKSIIWIASAEAAMAVGRRIANFKFVFQIHELYDKVYHYRYNNGFYFRNSVLNICPEFNRAAIFRYWYQLTKSPSVLVNAPYKHPRNRNLKISDPIIASKIQNLSAKKLILYMGMIAFDRDISILFEKINQLSDEYHLILLGRIEGDKKKFLDDISKFDKVTYLGEMNSPAHLEVASHAYIGVLSYSFLDLNNLFCAPNKIWEYAGFAIPMLSNDIPGLVNLLYKYNCGYSANFEDRSNNEIVRKIETIDENYSEISLNTKKMYDDYNYKEQLSFLLKEISLKLS